MTTEPTILAQNFAYANAQLFSPAFMASMAPGEDNDLGNCLLATEGVLTETEPQTFYTGRVTQLQEHLGRMQATDTLKEIMQITERGEAQDVFTAQKGIAASMRKYLDPRLATLSADITANRAGIPVSQMYRRKPLVHPGFKPRNLRVLVDAGAIGRPIAAELGAVLMNNLSSNIGMLRSVSRHQYPETRWSYALGPFLLLSGGALYYPDLPQPAGAIGIACLAFGVIFSYVSYWASTEHNFLTFNRAVNMPTLPTVKEIRPMLAKQERLRAGYEAALGGYPADPDPTPPKQRETSI